MRVYIDSSVIIDVALHYSPHYEKSRLLLMLGYISEFELWMSPVQLRDIILVVEDAGMDASDYMRELRKCIRVAPFSTNELDSATSRSWPSFESALIFDSALSIKADAIVTSNPIYFAESTIPVYSCESFFEYLKDSKNVDYMEMCDLAENGD